MGKRLFAACLIFGLIVSITPSVPSALAQVSDLLALLTPATGTISAAAPEQRWSFRAVKGQRFSMRMQATSGNLQPYLELLDANEQVLARSLPTSAASATIEGITPAESLTYTIRATFAPGGTPTEGDYGLIALPGFAYLLINDPMDARSPMRRWREPNSLVALSGGSLLLQFLNNTKRDRFIFTTADRLGQFADLHMQVDIEVTQANTYWETGLIVRGVDAPDGLDGYLLFVNARGQWRLAFSKNGIPTIIRDWTNLNRSLSGQFTLGLTAHGANFNLYLDGQYIDSVRDSVIPDAGVVGVLAGVAASPDNYISARFDNMVITLPVGEAAEKLPDALPTALQNWQGTPDAIMAELAAGRVVAGPGKPGLELASAFVNNNMAGGIVFTPLASGTQYADLVFSADAQWDTSSEDVACALGFRAPQEDTFTLVFLDRKGGYGVRQEIGGKPVQTVYDLSPAVKTDNLVRNRATIVAVGNVLAVYVNGVRVALLNVVQVRGQLYLAAYNYAQGSTLCRFTGVWLRDLGW